MLAKFKLWIYYTIEVRLLEDELFIGALYSKLELERLFREQLKRDIQQRAVAKARLAEIKKIQDKCSHLKGGMIKSPNSLDYCISDHRFPDGTRKVKCMLCSKEFDLESSEAVYMLENTTNTKTASESNPASYDQSEPVEIVFHDAIDVTRETSDAGHNMSEKEPFAPWMSRKRWLKLDALYKKLTSKKKDCGTKAVK